MNLGICLSCIYHVYCVTRAVPRENYFGIGFFLSTDEHCILLTCICFIMIFRLPVRLFVHRVLAIIIILIRNWLNMSENNSEYNNKPRYPMH